MSKPMCVPPPGRAATPLLRCGEAETMRVQYTTTTDSAEGTISLCHNCHIPPHFVVGVALLLCVGWVPPALPPSVAWGFADDYREIFCVGVMARARLLSVGSAALLDSGSGPKYIHRSSL